MTFICVSTKQIISINSKLLGNQAILKDSIESCFSSLDYLEDNKLKIASIVRSIVKNHYFQDANKRTAFAIFTILCFLNNEKIEDRNWADIFVKIASNQFSIEKISSLLY